MFAGHGVNALDSFGAGWQHLAGFDALAADLRLQRRTQRTSGMSSASWVPGGRGDSAAEGIPRFGVASVKLVGGGGGTSNGCGNGGS